MDGKKPSPCFWSAWGAWGQCDQPCNGGDQTRFRILLVGPDGSKAKPGNEDNCPGEQMEERSCNVQACNQGLGDHTVL